MKTSKSIVALVQSSLGAVMWFYIFGIIFTHPATFENLAIPLVAAAAASAVMSAFWSIKSSVSAYLVALYYSLPFLGWTIIHSLAGSGYFMTMIFWLSVSAGVYICGLAGSYSVRVIYPRGRLDQPGH